MIELRLRTKRGDEYMAGVAGTFVTDAMISLKMSGGEPVRVLRPDGKPLCVYLPGAMAKMGTAKFDEFSRIRGKTTNRGYASGSDRKFLAGAGRGRTAPITSSILGSFDPAGPQQYCRLTAFTAHQVDQWESLIPFFKRVGVLFKQNVPNRYAAQVAQASKTHKDWIIKGTPFTTITINNTYPTAVHTDKGDLDSGFSTLACLRRGDFVGGWLTFPQYGVTVDMQHGDLLLMDAHDWHGNTPIYCAHCNERLKLYDHVCEGGLPEGAISPERVSIVSYFRTKMVGCASLEDENARRLVVREKLAAKAIGIDWDADPDGSELATTEPHKT